MEHKKTVKIPFQLTIKELSERLNLSVSDVIKTLMKNGILATINETIDFETAVIISEELGFEAEPDQEIGSDEIITTEKLTEILRIENENKERLPERSPVVTILGHVDHGKTTLLDTLRKTHVAEKESGGITQHIRAYQVRKKGKHLTFIDTPGHEAFQSMRERGAGIADIAILVVAADDGVKPQTKEVIDFLLTNKVPMVVAINKIDKPEANINKVKQELAEHGILLEGYGGDIPFNLISAKNNLGLDELLDTLLLVSEIQDFRADEKRTALGVVLEAHKDPQKGPLATILIKTGTLKIGQDVLVGNIAGRIRKIEDYAGRSVQAALPSMPVTIIGLTDVPQSNDVLQVVENRFSARQKAKTLTSLSGKTGSLGQFSSKQLIKTIDDTKIKRFSIVLKADVQGTLEALQQIINTIGNEEVHADIIREGVGSITESDVKVAQSSNATIYGFNVNATSVANRMAQAAQINIKTYRVIYELVGDIKNEMSELLEPEIIRTDLGKLKILAVFKSTKGDMIVGGRIMSGKLVKGEKIELIRDKQSIDNGELIQLQHNKQDVSECKEGLECGLAYRGKEKIQAGDILLCYKEEKVKRKL
jgi:translation initiation factor IF-2